MGVTVFPEASLDAVAQEFLTLQTVIGRELNALGLEKTSENRVQFILELCLRHHANHTPDGNPFLTVNEHLRALLVSPSLRDAEQVYPVPVRPRWGEGHEEDAYDERHPL